MSLSLVLGLAGAQLGTQATTALAASAPLACPGESARDIGDVDGDGIPDPVVTTYGPAGGGPAYLDVHNSTAAEQVIGAADLGITSTASVGSSTLVVDVNRDGCSDVVALVYDRIYLIPGSPSGLVPGAAKSLADPETEQGNWGASMAVLKDRRLLAVGAPSSQRSPHHGGAVYLYPLAGDGTPGAATVIHQDTPGVPGTSESADGFGWTLAADGNLLAIGSPDEKVNRRRGAGAATLLQFTGVGRGFNAIRWTQDSPGFATRAESYDQFGIFLAVRGKYLAIGVPEESIGRARQTGIVHVVELTSAAKPKVARVYNFDQGSPGIPGKNETNDDWGQTLALGANIGCTPMTVVIGAHGEKLGKTPSGSVTLVGLGKKCVDQWLPLATFGVPFRYFGRKIVTLSSSVSGMAPDVVLVGDAFSRAAGNDVLETGQVVAVTTTSPGHWHAAPVKPRDGYHAYSNYGQDLGLANHG